MKVKCRFSIQARSAQVSLRSCGSKRSLSAVRSAAARRVASRMRAQSVQVTRASRMLRSICVCSEARLAGSTIRSISRCWNDSSLRFRSSPFSVRRCSERSLPAASRSTAKMGWERKCSVSERSVSAMPMLSTRKGMSSLTTSMTVCGERKPCSRSVGLNTRTSAERRRCIAKVRCASAAAASSSGERCARSSVSTSAKYTCTNRRQSMPAIERGGRILVRNTSLMVFRCCSDEA